MSDQFWIAALRPFLAVVLLFVAGHLARWFILPLIPDGRVRRFLTKKRSNRSEFFSRMDMKMISFFRRLLQVGRRKRPTDR